MMMRNRKAIRMKTAWSNLALSGIFARMQSLGFTVPWDASPVSLDMAYYNRSAHKIIAPVLHDFYMENGEQALTDEQKNAIVTAIWESYRTKWAERWALEMELNNLVLGERITETYTSREVRDKDTTSTGTIENESASTDTGTLTTSSGSTDSGTVTTESDTTETGTVRTDRDTAEGGTVRTIKEGTDTGTIATEGENTDTGTVTTSKTTTDGGTIQTTGQDDLSRYGFNSTNAVPTDTTETTGTETRNLTGSENTTETRNLAGGNDETQTRNLATSEDTTETRNLTGSDDALETRNLAGSESRTETRNLTGSETENQTRNLAGSETGSQTRDLAGTEDETITHEHSKTTTRVPADVSETVDQRRLMLQYNYYEGVYADIDSFVAIPIY